jgi:hypothetical protein
MSHNVPAVYDVLTARIKKCAAFLGLAKCGWSEPWEGAQRRPRRTEPRGALAPKRIQTCYVQYFMPLQPIAQCHGWRWAVQFMFYIIIQYSFYFVRPVP